MILIADSGSTKTDWSVLDKGKEIFSTTTEGMNPVFRQPDELSAIIRGVGFFKKSALKITEVNFFGAGCSNKKAKEKMQNVLKAFFRKAKVKVDTDLMGAAQAALGNRKGIVCILGTGSNCCYYDGKKVHQGNAGLGYILGDEGSAAYFGKKILAQYLYGKLPAKLKKDFKKKYKVSRESVIENIYSKPNANRYLASYAKFVIKWKDEKIVAQMVENGLNDFFETNIKTVKNYKKLTVNFVGSVAYYLYEELGELSEVKKFKMVKIWRKPIYGLTAYYLNKDKR